MIGARERVAIIVRPLDLLLLSLRTAMLPLLALIVSLRALQLLASSFTFGSSSWARGLAFAVAALTYVFVVQTPAISKRADRAFAMARRRALLACNHGIDVEHRGSGLSCRLTPEHLRAPTFRYDQQVHVVDRLLEACRDRTSTFWFVEGASGSGKSKTAFMLVERLVRDPKLFELTNRTYYYDFAISPEVQEALLDRLGTGRHENAVVIVDNFQRVSAATIRDLTRRLVDGTSRTSAHVLIFLARPMESWNLSPGSDVRLVSDAKKKQRHLTLSGTSEAPVVAEISRLDAPTAQLVRDLQGSGIASAPQLQIAQIVARHGSAPEGVVSMLQLIAGQTKRTNTSHSATVLGLIVGLAMHRGTFTRSEYVRSALAQAKVSPRRRAWASTIQLLLELRRLRRCGFLPTAYLGRRKYLFHEAFAELCIDRLAGNAAFSSVLHTVGTRRIAAGIEDPSVRWLLATEIGDSETMVALFDESLLVGAYSQMTACVERASLRSDLPACVQLQRGILLNRVAEFGASKQVMRALAEQLGGHPELEVQMITSAVEARHDAEAASAIAQLRQSEDAFTQRSGGYWQAHVDAHLGKFASQELRQMADQAADELAGSDSYWRLYQVARMHFDSLRHEYLEGRATPASIRTALESRAATQLKDRLPTFEALTSLYGRAHLLGHVLLPNYAIFSTRPSSEDLTVVGIPTESADSVSALVGEVGRLYNSARDEFWQYGDRESSFLQADVLNAQLIADDPDFEALGLRLHAYASFLREADYADLASYPHLYMFRWHMLQYYSILVEGRLGAPERADEQRAEAFTQLERVAELDKTCGNEYGGFRCQVLAALFDASENGVDPARFAALEADASKFRYGFEQKLAGHIVERETQTIAELRRVIRFYPFVHQ